MAGEVTLDRKTTLVIVTQDAESQIRQPWRFQRNAGKMARAGRPGVRTQERVTNTGDAWILKPLDLDLAKNITSEFSTSAIGPADVNLASGYTTFLRHKKRTETGMGASASLLTSGAPTFVKTVAAGSNWLRNLAADAAAFIAPVLATYFYPMDRVLAGTVTYPANTPFSLNLYVPNLVDGDQLVTFYFGGATDAAAVDPEVEDVQAGEYSITLQNNGDALLKEKDGGVWKDRYTFPWTTPLQATFGVVSLAVVPYERDRMLFLTAASGSTPRRGGSIVEGWLTAGIFALQANRGTPLYREGQVNSGHRHLNAMTGPGIIRLDVRRDLRLPIGLNRLFYPGAGTVIDDAFRIPFPVIAGTKMEVTAIGTTPTGTALAATLYRADTDVALSTDVDGLWDLEAGVQDYYVVWDFTSETGEQTPVLTGWVAKIDGLIETTTATSVTLDVDHADGVQVTGSSSDPSTGNATVTVKDRPGPRYGNASILKARTRYIAEVRTRYDDNPLHYSVLFAGETLDEGVEAILRQTSPGSGTGRWWEYGVPLGPMWSRVSDQFQTQLLTFYRDTTADQVNGEYPPWKITDIIRELFHLAGWTDTYLDIPDLDLRLWMEIGFDPEDFLLQPATKFGPAILKYARDFLDMFVVYDPNTSPGKWRLFYQPAPPYTSLHSFVLGSTDTGKLPHHAGTYGANTSFIRSETFTLRPVAPEANCVLVVGKGGILSDDSGAKVIVAEDWNPNSYNMDPAHPTAITDPADARHIDYLGGRKVPLLYVDPTILTQEGANYICRRLLQKTCFGHLRAHFMAPLCLVTNAADTEQVRPRPLQIADVVTVPIDEDGTEGTAIIDQAPTLDYTSDEQQWMHLECRIVRDV